MKRLLLTLTVMVLMAGCASEVKLDDVPVQDKTATSVAPAAADGAGVAAGGVSSVDLGKSAQPGVGPGGASIVYFDYDSYIVKPEFLSMIENHARFIKAGKAHKVAIEGHTDERGGREYNLALGQKRAEAVRAALEHLGVTGSQLEAVSFGKEKPAVAGSDEAAMAKNRRAEISYR